jgi:Hsp20/alpha crystallin family
MKTGFHRIGAEAIKDPSPIDIQQGVPSWLRKSRRSRLAWRLYYATSIRFRLCGPRWIACSTHSSGGRFGRFHTLPGVGRSEAVIPSIDVRETETELVVEADLPGMDEKDISVTLNNGILTLKGEKKSEREEKKDDYHLMERS